MIENLFTTGHFSVIGGVETWLYNIAKKYKDLDIAIMYDTGSKPQIDRIRECVRTIHYEGQHIKCKRAFFNYAMLGIDNIEAEEYIFFNHSDYTRNGIKFRPHPKITRYISVSEIARKTFLEATGIDSEVWYNPVIIEKPHHILKLATMSRMTGEKGYGRMKIMAQALLEKKIPYRWLVFTNESVSDTGLFTKMNPTFDISGYFEDADYIVQLSDYEASPYTVREAMAYGKPVIATNMEWATEAGVIDGKTGYLFDLSMSDLDVEKIYKKIPKFKPVVWEDKYNELLGTKKSTYAEELKKKIQVQCVEPYFDIQMQRNVAVGEVYSVPMLRAEVLVASPYVQLYKDKK